MAERSVPPDEAEAEAASDAYFLKKFTSMSCWKRPVKTTPADRPWIKKESMLKNSYAVKYVNYETEPRFVDTKNPLTGKEHELRLKEKPRPRKNRRSADKVPTLNNANGDGEDEDFIDEYGNIADPPTTTTTTEDARSLQEKDEKKWNSCHHEAAVSAGMERAGYQDLDSMKAGAVTERGFPSPPPFVAEYFRNRFSALNFFEQRKYLSLMMKFSKPESLQTKIHHDDYQLFLSFQDCVNDEQAEFQKLAKEAFYKQEKESALSSLRPEVRRYTDELHKSHLASRWRKYPQHYVTAGTAQLRADQERQSSTFEMSLHSTLLELGVIPELRRVTQAMMVSLKSPQRMLCRNSESLWEQHPPDDGVMPGNAKVVPTKVLYKVPVSMDPNAEKLAGISSPNVVISASALKTIFANFPPLFEADWEIPFRVKTFSGPTGSHTVIFVDKPLPACNLTTRDKSEWFDRKASKGYLQKPWLKMPANPRDNGGQLQPFDSDGVFGNTSVDVSDLETFGADAPSRMSQLDGNDSSDSSTDDDKPLASLRLSSRQMMGRQAASVGREGSTGDVAGQQARSLTPEKSVASKSENSNGSLGSCYYADYAGQTLATCNVGETGDFLPPEQHTNVSYRLWDLRRKNDSVDETVRVLIRSSTHGIRNRLKWKKSGSQTYTISCKQERQTLFGAESMSQTELAREWISTLVRPGSRLARLRVNAITGHVCMLQEKSLDDLTRDGQKSGLLKPEEQLGLVHRLFSSMAQISEANGDGHYLMQHHSSSGASVRVLVEATDMANSKRYVYDMHKKYRDVSAAADAPGASAAYIPLDFNVITPFHRAQCRVPGLFPPKAPKQKGED